MAPPFLFCFRFYLSSIFSTNELLKDLKAPNLGYFSPKKYPRNISICLRAF